MITVLLHLAFQRRYCKQCPDAFLIHNKRSSCHDVRVGIQTINAPPYVPPVIYIRRTEEVMRTDNKIDYIESSKYEQYTVICHIPIYWIFPDGFW